MQSAKFLYFGSLVALVVGGYLITTNTHLAAQQSAAVKIKANDIGGVVSRQQGTRSGSVGHR